MLVPKPESVRDARDFTRVTLRRWGLAAVCDDAELVVSELVTNALLHAMSGSGPPASDAPGSGPPASSAPSSGPAGSGGGEPMIGLRLRAQAPHLICTVTDPSHEIPLRRDSDPMDAGGRGLYVIESCSSRWGWRPLDEGGKVVWALLPGE